jgi:hypothetical protein
MRRLDREENGTLWWLCLRRPDEELSSKGRVDENELG